MVVGMLPESRPDKLFIFTESFPHGSLIDFCELYFPALREAFSEVVVLPYAPQGDSLDLDSHCYVDYRMSRAARKLRNQVRFYSRTVISGGWAIWRGLRERLAGVPAAALVVEYRRTLWAAYRAEMVRKFLLADPLRFADSVVLFTWTTSLALHSKKVLGHNALCVTLAHGYDLYGIEGRAIPFQHEVLKNMDLVIAISEHGAQYLRAAYPDVRDKILFSPLGSNFHAFNRSPPKGLIRVVSVSSLTAVKRPRRLWEALNYLAQVSTCPVEWVHIGDGPLIKEILYLSKRGCPNLSVVIRGQMFNEDIEQYFDETPISLFLNLSASEGRPISIMESLLSGVPVVATKAGGIPEMLLPGDGMVVDVDAAVCQVVDTMLHVINTDATELRIARRRRAIRNFGGDNCGSRLASILTERSAGT